MCVNLTGIENDDCAEVESSRVRKQQRDLHCELPPSLGVEVEDFLLRPNCCHCNPDSTDESVSLPLPGWFGIESSSGISGSNSGSAA